MDDLGFHEMQEMQKQLQEKYKDKWGGVSPEKARDQFLWMLVEAGEAADIIKKEGGGRIMENSEVRKHFIEEMSDLLMYFNDVMLCYSIKPEELREIYVEKHHTNMGRW